VDGSRDDYLTTGQYVVYDELSFGMEFAGSDQWTRIEYKFEHPSRLAFGDCL